MHTKLKVMKNNIFAVNKLTKSDGFSLIQLILSWTFIDLFFNMIGLWITKLLKPADYTYFDSISNEFVKPIAIQCALFGILLIIGFLFLKNRKFSYYVYVTVQFFVAHIILIANLNIHHGLHFVTTFKDAGLQYLSYCGQYLIDILYLYFPINGNFDNGMFMPDNLGTFYLHWIFLNLLYYFGISWLTVKFVKVFINVKPEKIKTESKKSE